MSRHEAPRSLGGGSATNHPQLFDAGRLLGATLLSLVLGIWITLVHKQLRGSQAAASVRPTTVLADHVQGR